MKKKYVAMSLLCSTVLMISACGSNVEDAQNSVSATANDSVVMVTSEPATVPTVEPTVEPTTTPDEKQSAIFGDSNSGSYNPSISTEDTSYCTFESIEPTTLYAKCDGTMFGNPNLYEGQLVTEGGFGAGDELTFNHKVTYNDVEYYVIKNDAGLILMASSDCLSETPVETQQETPVESTETQEPAPEQDVSSHIGYVKYDEQGNPIYIGPDGFEVASEYYINRIAGRLVVNTKYPKGSLATTYTDEELEEVIERCRSAGLSEEEINETLFAVPEITYITEEQRNDPEIDRRLRGEYTEEELEALRGLAGRHTH